MSRAVTSPSATAERTARPASSRARHGLLVSLFAITAINYLDRTNMAVALPHITDEFNLTATEAGLVLSAFSWVYAALQVPGGWFVDRIGPRLAFGYAMVGWSLCTVAFFFARSFGVVVGLRVGLGLFETPAFPANNRLVSNWFPSRERGRATAWYTAGEYVGLAVAVPLLSLLVVHFGWPSVFLATGVVGLLFSVVWWTRVYDTPERSPRVSAEELAYIRQDGDSSPEERNAAAAESTWRGLAVLARSRRMWGLYIAQFANASVLFFFLTWFPSYLVEDKHMDTIKAGFWGSLPYLAAMAGVLIAGWGSDRLLRSGMSRTRARKLPVMAGLCVAPIIMAANFTDSAPLVILFMSTAFFAQGFMQLGWAALSDIAPVRLMGLAGGTFSFAANLGGALAPLLIGVLIDRTGSMAYGLVYIAALAVAGFLAYAFLIDKVERLDA
ncbi:major facilitator superfamily MFS_1 [Actinobacteria bacterium OK074]|nr:major facilitator superfamily MFS_1 [Actinobacteria bacterium OK074]